MAISELMKPKSKKKLCRVGVRSWPTGEPNKQGGTTSSSSAATPRFLFERVKLGKDHGGLCKAPTKKEGGRPTGERERERERGRKR